MATFTVSQSQIEIESKFEPRLWALIHDTPKLYEALLTRLSTFGLRANDLRPDGGDGSIGGHGLSFWLWGFQASVKLRLETFVCQCGSLAAVPRTQFVNLLDRMRQVVAQATGVPPRYSSHTITYTCHGLVERMKGAEFTRRFVRDELKIDKLGPPVASGTAIYYGPADQVLSTVLTVDPSQIITDGLFVRVTIVTDGSFGSAEELNILADDHIARVFTALGLDANGWWL